MKNQNLLQIKWQPREQPLRAAAVAARGPSAASLAKRLLQFGDETLQKLSGASATNLLIILGDAEDLPWVDGAIYLGRDLSAPSILLPTTHLPNVPINLFEQILILNFREQLPFAVLRLPNEIVELKKALPLARAVLQSWLEKSLFQIQI